MNLHRKNFLFAILLTLFLFLQAACQDTKNIVNDLPERDANTILVLFAQNGISAHAERIEKNQEVSWTIIVNSADEMEARRLLDANHLPRVRQGGLAGVCKDSGLIVTPKTEKCREMLILKGEVINSLESIPGVVSADVVLNIPDKNEFPTEDTVLLRPTASVTVQCLKDPNTVSALTEDKIQQFVSNAVTGLDPRDVTVIISYTESASQIQNLAKNSKAETPVSATTTEVGPDSTSPTATSDVGKEATVGVAGLKMDASSALKLKIVGAAFLCLFLFVTVALVITLFKLVGAKKKLAQSSQAEDEEAADQKLLQA